MLGTAHLAIRRFTRPMLHDVILHPAVVAYWTRLFRNFSDLSLTSQMILCTLVQVKARAMKDEPLPENLLGIMRILGQIPGSYTREELDPVCAEIYDTLQRVAAREAGEQREIEVWFRDIS